jgi:predicted transcriptional regulator
MTFELKTKYRTLDEAMINRKRTTNAQSEKAPQARRSHTLMTITTNIIQLLHILNEHGTMRFNSLAKHMENICDYTSVPKSARPLARHGFITNNNGIYTITPTGKILLKLFMSNKE